MMSKTEAQQLREADMDELMLDRWETVPALAEITGIGYDTLVKAAREDRLNARKSGTAWLSTRRAVREALGAGRIRPHSAYSGPPPEGQGWRMTAESRAAQVGWLNEQVAGLLESYDPADYEGGEALGIAHGLYNWWRRENDALPEWFDKADAIYMLRALETQIE